MATTVKNWNTKDAFFLDLESLNHLMNIYSESCRESEIKIICSDGSSISFDDYKSLVNFPNSKSRYIKSLHIGGYHDNINMKFFNDYGSYTISYQISGDDDYVIYTSQKIDNILRNVLKKYSFIISEYLYNYIFDGFVLMAYVFYFFEFHVGGELKSNDSDITVFLKDPITNIILCILFIIFCFRRNFIPIGGFDIGYGKARYTKNLATLKWFIGGFISIILALIASFLSKYYIN